MAHTGKAQINAVFGLGVEAQVNQATKRLARRKRQRGELKVGLAKAFSPNARPNRRARQNDAHQAEGKRKEGLGIGSAPQCGHGRGRDREYIAFTKIAAIQRPAALLRFLLSARRAAQSFRHSPGIPIGLLGCRLLL